MPDEISLTPEHERIIKEHEILRDSLLKNQEERDYLIYQALPALNSLYLSKVGKLKLELLETRLEVYRLKRKMEIIQSCINRNSEVVIEAIEILLEKEIEEHKKKIETESQRLEAALKFVNQPSLNPDESKELKSLYYKLARLLHPDLNPDQNATMKLLWLKVSECYQNGDLDQMKLLELLSANEISEDKIPSALDELKRRNELYSKRIMDLIKEIEHIKSSFPFTFVDLLGDEAWVNEENNNSLNAISKAKEEKTQYENMIAVLLSGTE